MEDSTIMTNKQRSIPAPGHVLPPPRTEELGGQIQVFQFTAAKLGTQESKVSISLASSPELAQLTSRYRHATLVEVTAHLHPTEQSILFPTVVQVVWVPANSTASPSDIMSVYGGASHPLGGAITGLKTIPIPLPLESVNLAIKDSVLYTDTPKLLAYCNPSKPSTTPSVLLTIQGKVRLSAPLLQPLSA